jgi:hypothetical protein
MATEFKRKVAEFGQGKKNLGIIIYIVINKWHAC